MSGSFDGPRMNNWSQSSSLGPGNGSTTAGQVSVVATVWGVSSSSTNTGPMTSGNTGYHNQSSMHFSGTNNNNSNNNNNTNNLYGCVPPNHNNGNGTAVGTGGYINGSTSMTTSGGVIGGHASNSSLKSQLVNNVPNNYGHRGMAGVGGQPINSGGNSVGGSYMR